MKYLIPLLLSWSVNLAAEPRTLKALSSQLTGSSFKSELVSGFHFNEKAPNLVTVDGKTIKPGKIAARSVEFSGLPERFKVGIAALYVCDDELTYCETRTIDLKKGGPSAAANLPSGSAKRKAGKINSHGFIEDDFKQAVDKAKAEGKLVLIDFGARWCPSCVRLEQEIFDSTEFKSISKDFVKLKVDVDRFENGVLAEKYSIKGVPTVLVINAQQEEIARLVDYHAMNVWNSFLVAIKTDPMPLSDLQKKASDSPTRLRLARRLMAVDLNAEALAVLEEVEPRPKEYLDALVGSVEEKDKKIRIQTYKKAIAAEPNSTRSIGFRGKLVEVLDDPDEKKKVVDEGVALAGALLADPDQLKVALATETTGEFTGFERLLVAIYRADLIASATTSDEVRAAAWGDAVQIGLDSKIPLENVGANMRLISFMGQSKRYTDAEKLTAAILKKYPQNTDIQRRRMKILVDLKKYDAAIALGPRVIKNSYGRNEFWAAEVLARAYLEAGQAEKAKNLIDKYLSRSEIEWSNMKGTRKTLEELRLKLPQG